MNETSTPAGRREPRHRGSRAGGAGPRAPAGGSGVPAKAKGRRGACALCLVAAAPAAGAVAGCEAAGGSSGRPARERSSYHPPGPAAEAAVERVPLAWPLNDATAELSDLAWAGDDLILLPQFPSRFGPAPDGNLYKVSRAALERWLDGDRRGPLDVRPVAFDAPGVVDRVEGFQGFEALAIDGGRVFLTAESRSEGRMRAHLVRGEIDAAHERVTVRADALVELPCPNNLNNIAYEALTVFRGSVVTFYESNGQAVVPSPAALFWDDSQRAFARHPMSPLEYRVTGATAPDAGGRFWVTNVFWPGDRALRADGDPIAEAFGRGATHAHSEVVERLVELRVGPGGVERTTTPPVQLALSPDGRTRNWEGVALLGDRGFVLVTDEHPTTILAFVPWPPLAPTR